MEVVAGETRIALDAGTGLRRLGGALLGQGKPVDVTVLLSHVHWDHIQGLPFFGPIYSPATKLTIAGGAPATPLRESLRRQMSAPNFPVDWNDLPAKIDAVEMRDGSRLSVGEPPKRFCGSINSRWCSTPFHARR